MRTAHANAARLSYITTHLTGNPNFWGTDPDRMLGPELAGRFERGTGIHAERLQRLVLHRYRGRLFTSLDRNAPGRWLLPLAKRGYQATRLGSLYCPLCLAESRPHLRLVWRLSFVTACPQHGCEMLDGCPACGHPFAPHLNDLGPGKEWFFESDLPFRWCPQCEQPLTATPPQAPPEVLELQGRMLRALEGEQMPWDGLGEVPSLEGFTVLHKLLTVVAGPNVRAALDFLPDAAHYPPQHNRSFKDFRLSDRRALMGRLAYLVSDWPERLEAVAPRAKLSRRPLVRNMATIPSWYDTVAERLYQGNGHRTYRPEPLVPWLTLSELAARRDAALTETEQQWWSILWHYAQRPEKAPVARQLGVSWQMVHRTVKRFNAAGPDALILPTRGRSNRKKRLLTAEQEQELQAWLGAGLRKSNEEMRDWFEQRTRRRPDSTTLWMYRRGISDHSSKGRKSTYTYATDRNNCAKT